MMCMVTLKKTQEQNQQEETLYFNPLVVDLSSCAK